MSLDKKPGFFPETGFLDSLRRVRHRIGGTGGDSGADIAVEGAGNAYVTGDTSSSNFPTTAGAFDMTGSFDAFVTKLNAAGSALVYLSRSIPPARNITSRRWACT